MSRIQVQMIAIRSLEARSFNLVILLGAESPDLLSYSYQNDMKKESSHDYSFD